MATERTDLDLRSERGSVLMLMPAAVVIVFVLAAIAVDQALAFGQQRALVSAAQACANDAASWGADPTSIRDGSGLRYDPARVARVISADLAAHDVHARVSWTLLPDRIVVRLRGHADRIFTRAAPGMASRTELLATAEAVLRRR
ncbi:MAG: hypothetical protein JWN46_1910 [Acidimicrobiales bacterium]|nr:hypothetical protein [Acidimicrobiales bacterium]